MGAAGAENQYGLARKVHAVGTGQVGKPGIVGVITVQPAIPVDDGIHRADGRRFGVDHIAVGDDQLLVGNRHVDGRKVPPLHKSTGLVLGGQRHQLVGIISDLLVDDLGIAVPKLRADQAVSCLFHTKMLLVFWAFTPGAGRAFGPACRSARSAGPTGQRQPGCFAPPRRGARCRGRGGP